MGNSIGRRNYRCFLCFVITTLVHALLLGSLSASALQRLVRCRPIHPASEPMCRRGLRAAAAAALSEVAGRCQPIAHTDVAVSAQPAISYHLQPSPAISCHLLPSRPAELRSASCAQVREQQQTLDQAFGTAVLAAAQRAPFGCVLVVFCCVVSLLLGLLTSYHVYLTSTNQTTNENVRTPAADRSPTIPKLAPAQA